MSLKKILKRGEKGQVIIEYFILFALITAISIVSVSAIVSKTQETTERFTNKSARKLMPELPVTGGW